MATSFGLQAKKDKGVIIGFRADDIIKHQLGCIALAYNTSMSGAIKMLISMSYNHLPKGFKDEEKMKSLTQAKRKK